MLKYKPHFCQPMNFSDDPRISSRENYMDASFPHEIASCMYTAVMSVSNICPTYFKADPVPVLSTQEIRVLRK